MSDLDIFVSRTDLDRILHDFAIHRDLRGALQVREGYELYDPTQVPSELTKRNDVSLAFLFPNSQVLPVPVHKETIMPRFMGWMHVRPGHLVERDGKRILLMTSIQAEDRQELPFRPATWLRALKKKLGESAIRFGTNGVNVVHGDSAVYKDIGYSETALQLYREGVIWKQFIVDNVEFFPSD